MSLDASLYLHPTRGNVVKALALALALLRRVPRNAPDGVRKAAKRLRLATQELQERRRARALPAAGAADSREANAALDVAWGALRDALAALARLPERCPSSKQAKALLARLFPAALGFLSQGDHAVWVESDELLRAVREEGLGDAIGALLPADVLGEVERAHKAFGDVIGMSADVAPAAPKVDLAAARDAVYAAVTAYAVQTVAAADDADAATVEALRHALEPIVEQRVRTRKRAEEAVEEDDDADGADAEGAAPNGAPANDDDAAPAEGVSRVA